MVSLPRNMRAAVLTISALSARWPALIDSAILSRGTGFVGLERSTMSLVASLRARDWNGAPTRMVCDVVTTAWYAWLVLSYNPYIGNLVETEDRAGVAAVTYERSTYHRIHNFDVFWFFFHQGNHRSRAAVTE